MTSSKNKSYQNDLIKAVYDKLMDRVAQQDVLILGWTKYYITIQAGLAIALAFLIRLEPKVDSLLIIAGSILIPILGILSVIFMTRIIRREQFWQHRYIAQIGRLPELPKTYRRKWISDNPDSENPGHIGKQFIYFRIAVVVIWALWIIAYVTYNIYVTCICK